MGPEHPRRRQRAKLIRTNHAARRQKDFRSHHVLAQLAHMLPGKGRFFDPHLVSVRMRMRPRRSIGEHILHHNDGIGVFRQRMTGIDPESVLADGQRFWPVLRGAEGRIRPDGDAVHGRSVKGRRRQRRDSGLGQGPALGFRQRNFLNLQRITLSGGKPLQPKFLRVRQRRELKIYFSAFHIPSFPFLGCKQHIRPVPSRNRGAGLFPTRPPESRLKTVLQPHSNHAQHSVPPERFSKCKTKTLSEQEQDIHHCSGRQPFPVFRADYQSFGLDQGGNKS